MKVNMSREVKSGKQDDDVENGKQMRPKTTASAPVEETLQDVSIPQMFRYADGADRWLVIIALIASVINGALVPIFSIIFGNLVNAFGDGGDDLMDEVNKFVLYLLYLAIAALISGYLEVAFFSLTGFRQASAVRKAFLQSILNQDISWYDCKGGSSKVLQGLNEETVTFQNAVSERFGNFIRNVTTCIAGLIVAFWRGWDMALVIVATMPFLMGVGMAISMVTGRLRIMVSAATQRSNGIAEEALVNIRTITSYGLQENAAQKYEASLEQPRKAGVKQGFLSGLTVGATAGVFSCSYALAIWYGSLQVADGDYDGGRVINILFAGVMAGFSLGQAVPNIQFIEAGRAACAQLFSVIDRRPAIDTTAPGEVLSDLSGDIEFESISFSYPTRPDRMIFEDFSLIVPAGKSVALVGESGSGKSSIIQLLERFYDPTHGKLMVDGHDIRSFQLDWWRSQVALVSQEPTLFNDTIFANIMVAKPGATMDEVVAAASAANAHTFISRLPEGYHTPVGEQGTQLSGGQRQRIAIARAILRNPRVLLLDEATSALDNQSEKLVQESLDTLMAGRTTVIVAHRLSTVINADIIAVVKGGKIIDQGTHAELMKRGGFYASLVSRQMMDEGEEKEETSEVTTGKKLKMRDSVLTRMSVRLSVIPQEIMKKLKRTSNPEDLEASSGLPLTRLAALNAPEWKYGVLGIISSAALGLQMPAFALALSGIVGVYFEPTADEIRAGGQKWAGIYVGIGVGCWIFGMLQGWAFGVMGQNLAVRVKIMFFRAVLRQEISWHDMPENNTGKVMSRLSSDTMAIRGAVGDQLGVIVQNLSTVIAAFAIAFSSSWKLTLVVTSLLPIMSAAQLIQTLMLTGQFSQGGDDALEANQVALEGVRGIKVVSAYSLQGEVVKRYLAAMTRGVNVKMLHFAGVAYGFSQFVLYNVICLAFWYGAKGVSQGSLTFEELMKAFCALFFATFSLAQANVQFPDIGRAKKAAESVFSIVDRQPDIDVSSEKGARLPMVDGDVSLENVTFAYPARPSRLIFKSFTLSIPAGTSCALVGESGHGKSTIVGLLERFYDATDGKVLLDGVDVRSLHLPWLRSIIGLVGQEPVMFRTSIIENIKNGNPNATVSQVVEAAKAANALDFINSFPEQFDTQIGDGGVQLSGGQKQRIAIARAILRNPKILLLDEATSALDAESEAIVQAALETLMVGRTTVIIAHRLSTVRTANKIAAIYRGRVLEQGTHDELMELDRYYAYLVKASQC